MHHRPKDRLAVAVETTSKRVINPRITFMLSNRIA